MSEKYGAVIIRHAKRFHLTKTVFVIYNRSWKIDRIVN